MKKLLICMALATVVSAFAAIPEKVLFKVTGPDMNIWSYGLEKTIVQSPGLHKELVIKTDYLKYEKGGHEWPALVFDERIIGKPISLKEWDSFVLTVFNPYDDRTDLGICFDGDKGRHSFHINLQPSAWNHWIYKTSDIIERCGGKLVKFNFFLTRPEKVTTFYFQEAKLVKNNPAPETPVSSNYTLVDFEAAELPAAIELNNVKAELTTEWAKDGKQSVKLTYPKHVAGAPGWPSFQFWTGADDKVGIDLSAFSGLEFTLHSGCPIVTPIKAYVSDIKGNTSSQEYLINPGQELPCHIDLKKIGLDTQHIKQIDFFMSSPSEDFVLYLDSIRLVAPKADEITEWKGILDKLSAEIKGVSSERGKRILNTIDGYYKEIEDAYKAVESTNTTMGELRKLSMLGFSIKGLFDGNSRDITEERILLATEKAFPGSPFGIAVADSMLKVMIKDRPLNGVNFTETIELEMAKNEYESVQVVAIGYKDAVAGVEVGELRNGDYVLPADAVTVSLVGHVLTKKPPYAASYQGWWPDPLLDWQKTAKVAPHEAVAFWVRIKTPENAKAGNYTGNVKVTADGKQVATLKMNLRVFDFAVPTKSPLDTAVDFRDHIKQVWGKDMSEEKHDEILRQCVDTIVDYKLDYNNIYGRPSMGDVTNYPRMKVGIPHWKRIRDKGLLRQFCIMYIGTDRNLSKADDPRVQSYIDFVLKALDYWVPILEKEGLLEYAYLYGYDEIPSSQFPVMAKVYSAIKAKYPNIPLTTTAYDHTFGTETCLKGCVDVFTPLTPKYNLSYVNKARAMGTKVWWYTCIGPANPYANWFVEYALIESRLLMGMMTAKFRPDGYLYYAVTRWPVNHGPIVDGPYTNWNPASYKTANGDGSIFCAGPKGLIPTIRVENIRDGLEDYAYFLELEKRIAEKKNIAPELLKEAKAALVVPNELVDSMKDYSHDPVLLRKVRRNVAEMIEKLK